MGRRYASSYAGPENFTPFTGSGAFFRVTDTSAPELYALAKKFPAAFTKALKSMGWFIRGEMKSALRQGGPKGQTWQGLSRMHIYRRMDLLRAGQVDAVTGAWTHGRRFGLKKRLGHKKVGGKERMMDRWKGRGGDLRGRGSMGGRLVNAVRYKMLSAGRVDIGALSPSAAKYLEAVQGGKRGTRGVFQFAGTQRITPAMRRALWAAGIPISKKGTLEQPTRPLVAPIYQMITPELESYMVAKIKAVMER